jgi:homoserine O-acetyltransferase
MPQFKLPEILFTRAGNKLIDSQLYYECIGNPSGEVIWICHALTGSATIEEWWPSLFKNSGGFIDLSRHYVVCANCLGSCYGSSGPKSQEGIFPALTHRDIADVFHLLKEHLQIEKIDILIGGSLGGQQALEWSICFPKDMRHTVLIACNAWHSSWGIAWNELQRKAIELGKREEGLSLARQIAMLSYRSASDFEQKTADSGGDPHTILSYLEHQGNKFVNRFSHESYCFLSHMMDQHDIRKGRDQTAENILAGIAAAVLVIGISSDVLFPITEQQWLAAAIPNASFTVIDSRKGHDAFLLEGNFISKEIEKHCFQKQHLV